MSVYFVYFEQLKQTPDVLIYACITLYVFIDKLFAFEQKCVFILSVESYTKIKKKPMVFFKNFIYSTFIWETEQRAIWTGKQIGKIDRFKFLSIAFFGGYQWNWNHGHCVCVCVYVGNIFGLLIFLKVPHRLFIWTFRTLLFCIKKKDMSRTFGNVMHGFFRYALLNHYRSREQKGF